MFGLIAAICLVLTACAGGDTSSTEETTTTAADEVDPTTAPTTTQAVAPTTAAAPTTVAAPTTAVAPDPALSQEGNVYSVNWAGVADPFWNPNAGSAADPFFHIHTEPAQDGFFFALEMYTTGYGALWTGELGEVEIICDEASPAPNSTGICPHFDPDGPGPLGDLNADFAATGSITIDQLDDDGYNITVNEVLFSDGSSIAGFQLTGP